MTLGFQPRGLDHGPGPLAKDLVVKMADYLKELDDKEKNEMQPYFSHRSPPQTFIAFLIINSGRGRFFLVTIFETQHALIWISPPIMTSNLVNVIFGW